MIKQIKINLLAALLLCSCGGADNQIELSDLEGQVRQCHLPVLVVIYTQQVDSDLVWEAFAQWNDRLGVELFVREHDTDTSMILVSDLPTEHIGQQTETTCALSWIPMYAKDCALTTFIDLNAEAEDCTSRKMSEALDREIEYTIALKGEET